MRTELIRAFVVNGHKIKITIGAYSETAKQYYIQALVDNRLNLCCIHHGYLKSSWERNTRLRSPKSILKEKLEIYRGFRAYIEEHFERFIIDRATLTVKICGDFAVIKGGAPRDLINTVNIRSKQSGLSVSWHFHDVYKRGEIEIEAVRCPETGQLQYFADDQDLYDREKLEALANSETYKRRGFSFFFYNEVGRLLGRETKGSPKAMSGLFSAA